MGDLNECLRAVENLEDRVVNHDKRHSEVIAELKGRMNKLEDSIVDLKVFQAKLFGGLLLAQVFLVLALK